MLYYLAMMLARRSPMFLLSLGVIVFAIVRWKRHPRVSLMTMLAFVVYTVEGTLFSVFLYWLPRLMDTMRLPPRGTENLYFVLFFFEDFVFALIIILLVGAAFSGRGAHANEAYPPPPGTI